MVLRITFFLSIIGLISCGPAPAGTHIDGPIDPVALYQLHCTDCHGADGKLGLTGATDLSISVIDLEARVDIIENGSENGKMSPFGIEHYGSLSDEQIAALATFIETLRN